MAKASHRVQKQCFIWLLYAIYNTSILLLASIPDVINPLCIWVVSYDYIDSVLQVRNQVGCLPSSCSHVSCQAISRFSLHSSTSSPVISSQITLLFQLAVTLTFEPRQTQLSCWPRSINNVPYAHSYNDKEVNRQYDKGWPGIGIMRQYSLMTNLPYNYLQLLVSAVVSFYGQVATLPAINLLLLPIWPKWELNNLCDHPLGQINRWSSAGHFPIHKNTLVLAMVKNMNLFAHFQHAHTWPSLGITFVCHHCVTNSHHGHTH